MEESKTVDIEKVDYMNDAIIVRDVNMKNQKASKKLLLTANAAAKILGYSFEHFSRMKKKGIGPAPEKRGGRDFYTLESLKEWGRNNGIDIDNYELA